MGGYQGVLGWVGRIIKGGDGGGGGVGGKIEMRQKQKIRCYNTEKKK